MEEGNGRWWRRGGGRWREMEEGNGRWWKVMGGGGREMGVEGDGAEVVGEEGEEKAGASRFGRRELRSGEVR